MIASRFPHRVAVLWPQLTGVDATLGLPLLAWVAMTDAVLRTPGLGAIAQEDYHVAAVDGRHVAVHALHGADAPAHWFAAERRDEVVWLSGAVDGVLRLHAAHADGRRESFDAIGLFPLSSSLNDPGVEPPARDVIDNKHLRHVARPC